MALEEVNPNVQDRLDEAKGVEGMRGATFRKKPGSDEAPDDRYTVTDPEEALRIWGAECAASNDQTPLRPSGYENASPVSGDSHERQVMNQVNTTRGIEEARAFLRPAYYFGERPTLFAQRIANRIKKRMVAEGILPFTSIPKSQGENAVRELGGEMPTKRGSKASRLLPGMQHAAEVEIDPERAA